MTTAFQPGAFQNPGFQIDEDGSAGCAFQIGAFQVNAFQQCTVDGSSGCAFQIGAFQTDAFQQCSPAPSVGGTFATFPPRKRLGAWWPTPKKKLEEDFAEKVAAIVEPLPERSAEIVSKLSRELMREREEVAQLRPLVKAKLAEEEIRFTAAAKEAVTKIQEAAVAIEAKRVAEEYEQQRLKKEQRNRNALKILKMLH